MRFIRIFCYDLHQGILRRWYLFIPPFLFAMILCLGIIHDVEMFQSLQINTMTAGNLFAYFFQGSDEYIPTPGVPFVMPLEWFLLLIYPICLVADYPVHDLKGTGEMVLLKSGSRINWILSKFCWCIVIITTYWLLLILSTVLVGAIFCSPSLFPNAEPLEYLLGSTFAGQNTVYQLCSIYLLPYFVMLSSGIVHIVLSLCLSPFFSILLITAFKVAAAYYMLPLLPSEYSMLKRNVSVVSNGFSPSLGLFLCAIIIVIGILCGCIFFRFYDILYKKEV